MIDERNVQTTSSATTANTVGPTFIQISIIVLKDLELVPSRARLPPASAISWRIKKHKINEI